jgi:hypothetical protein
VNAVAVIYVNEHLEELRAEAQRKRRAASLAPKPSLRARIAAAAADFDRRFGSDVTGPNLPTLSHWPYRV